MLIVLLSVGVVITLAVALPARSRERPATVPAPVPVEVERIAAIPALADRFTVNGVVEPNRTVTVAAEVSGRIESYGPRAHDLTVAGRTFAKGMVVAEGQPVAKGDCLVVLDDDLLRAAFNRAKAQAAYDQRQYARMRELYEKDVAGKQELDQARTAVAVSQAVLVQAAERLDRTRIEAPISGILNDLPQEVGQFVQPGVCVAEIVDIDTVKVVVDVSERNIGYLKTGDQAAILPGFADEPQVSGRITFISEVADQSARTTRVEVSADNAGRLLRSGQIVRVRLTRRTIRNAIMIPLDAVISLEKGKVVYVVVDGKARRRNVEIDMDCIKGASVRVTGGLSGGEELIVLGQRYVADGQLVAVSDVGLGRGSPAGSPTTRPTIRPVEGN